MKLNLGCGNRKFDGFVNVDKYGAPDLLFDLENLPWPWADSSVTEVKMIHVLEHLGKDTDVFLGIMKELYRVCADQALVEIDVPHPRSDYFLGDPTHVRPINYPVLSLFSKKENQMFMEVGGSNTPLALILNVDFELEECFNKLAEPWLSMYQKGELTLAQLEHLEKHNYNIVNEINMKFRVIKPA